MANEDKLAYAKERHAMALAMRDWPEVQKWQQHVIDLGGEPHLGVVNNSMQGFMDKLKGLLAREEATDASK